MLSTSTKGNYPSVWTRHFNAWDNPPSDTEEERIQTIANKLKETLHEHPKLTCYQIDVIAQGSYRNNTNVRLHSDMDLAVVWEEVLYYKAEGCYLPQLGDTEIPLHTLQQKFLSFKSTLVEVLISNFGQEAVKRGNKAINIKFTLGGHTMSADVVPAIPSVVYRSDNFGSYHKDHGIAIYPDTQPNFTLLGRQAEPILNFPEQHYRNGVAKNEITSRRYKKVVRILKQLKDKMEREGIPPIPSFLLECLVYQCSDELFMIGENYQWVVEVLWCIKMMTETPNNADPLMEVNGIKQLFGVGQPWQLAQANRFAADALTHIRG
ncbi:MAG: nucleotidyltransferase [Magnetococcales bacterium]|nr:nucleotidyltransferase [Magnetococcales bacterium]